jgi:hypothetical protein
VQNRAVLFWTFKPFIRNSCVVHAVSVPSQPYTLKVLSRNDTSLLVKWEPPRHKNGKLLGYLLYYLHNSSRVTVNITDVTSQQYYLTGLC